MSSQQQNPNTNQGQFAGMNVQGNMNFSGNGAGMGNVNNTGNGAGATNNFSNNQFNGQGAGVNQNNTFNN